MSTLHFRANRQGRCKEANHANPSNELTTLNVTLSSAGGRIHTFCAIATMQSVDLQQKYQDWISDIHRLFLLYIAAVNTSKEYVLVKNGML